MRNEGPNEGMLFIRTQSAHPGIIVRHATVPRTRRRVYLADDVLSDVESNLLERGAAEMEMLLERKALYVQSNPERQEPYADYMPPWDCPFYSHLVQEELNIGHEQIAEYLPLRNTLMSMLEVFASCLQLQFMPLAPEALADSTWRDDVEAWSVWDSREETAGEFVGYLYADVLQRLGKHKGSQNMNPQCVSSLQIICPGLPLPLISCHLETIPEEADPTS